MSTASETHQRRRGNELSRRGFLKTGGVACGTFTLPQNLRAKSPSGNQDEQKRAVRPFNRYSDLLETLKKRSHKLRVLG